MKVHCIEITGLKKTYPNGFTALDDISFKIDRGGLVGYLGPNGAGKTTTIKILTNLIRPTSGRVMVNGIDVNRFPKQAMRYIGALIEVPGVYDYLTPRELLLHFGRIYGMKRTRIDTRIKEVLKEVGLSDWERKKIGGFSTGMQRRFAIAKALLHEPEILILDEPVLGLDPNGIKEVRGLIRDLNSRGMTIFLSSHLLQEVSQTCDHIIVLKEGRVLADDDIDSVLKAECGNYVELTLLKPVDRNAVRSLEGLAAVDSVHVQGRKVRISYSGDENTCSQILDRTVSCGMRVVSFVPKRTDLEDYYLRMIGRGKGVVN